MGFLYMAQRHTCSRCKAHRVATLTLVRYTPKRPEQTQNNLSLTKTVHNPQYTPHRAGLYNTRQTAKNQLEKPARDT